MQVLLGFLFLMVFFYVLKNAFQSSRANYRKWLTKITLIVAGGILLLLVLTGRLHVLAALGAGLLMLIRQLPLLVRALPVLQTVFGQKAKSAPAGQQSTLQTSLLEMTLDHDTGEIDGVVCASGSFQGQRLSEMDAQSLQALYRLALTDHHDSIEVIETFLERTYGEQWRQRFDTTSSSEGSTTTADELSVDDACDILGVNRDASEEDIISAHRRMMQKFHPDRGGSNYLAARINAAKAVLLGNITAH